MNSYFYSVSLRIFHPHINPEEISRTLMRSPTRMWMAGTARQTPKGSPLEGFYPETYWYTDLIAGREQSSNEMRLEDFLGNACQQLQSYDEFFSRIRTENGRVELFIGLHGDSNHGFNIPAPLMTLLSKLGISLGFDLYPAS